MSLSHTSRFPSSRQGIAALVACAYIAATAWLVRVQGEAYRDQLRGRRLAQSKAFDSPKPPVIALNRPVVDSTPIEVRRVETPGPAPALPTPQPSVEPKPRPIPTPEPVPETPAKAAPAPSVLDPFWELPEQKAVWDVDHLSLDDEIRLGATLHQMVLHTHKSIEEGPLPRRVLEAAEPFLTSLSRKGLDYNFTILDCDEVNAFSHPGGYVYLCKGIFHLIGEDEDFALAFLLAHEIAHVDLNHALEILQDPGVRNLQVATVPKFYGLILPFGYKETQDLEADRWAASRMSRGGSSPHDIQAFLRKLDSFAQKNGFDVKRRLPNQDPQIAPLDHHLRSHPVPRTRLKSLLEPRNPTPRGG